MANGPGIEPTRTIVPPAQESLARASRGDPAPFFPAAGGIGVRPDTTGTRVAGRSLAAGEEVVRDGDAIERLVDEAEVAVLPARGEPRGETAGGAARPRKGDDR